jgi:hypothetical protein
MITLLLSGWWLCVLDAKLAGPLAASADAQLTCSLHDAIMLGKARFVSCTGLWLAQGAGQLVQP